MYNSSPTYPTHRNFHLKETKINIYWANKSNNKNNNYNKSNNNLGCAAENLATLTTYIPALAEGNHLNNVVSEGLELVASLPYGRGWSRKEISLVDKNHDSLANLWDIVKIFLLIITNGPF